MNTKPNIFREYIETLPNFKAEEIDQMINQMDQFFRYCEESSRNPKAEDSAKTYREWISTQISNTTLLQMINQALLLWAEYHSRYSPSKPGIDLYCTRTGFVGKNGTITFLPVQAEECDPSQISFLNSTEPSDAIFAEWMKSSKELASEMQSRGLSWRTQTAYLGNLQRFRKYLSPTTAPADVTWHNAKQFLSHLLHEQRLSSASLRFYTFSLKFWFENILRSAPGSAFEKPIPLKPRKPPVVFTKEEAKEFLSQADGKMHLLFALLYGCGMRLNEGLCLRIKDIDFENRWILVLDGKGSKGRHVPLPEKVIPELRNHIDMVTKAYEKDLRKCILPWMPSGILRNASFTNKHRLWQWLFPADSLMSIEGIPGQYRWHIPQSNAQKAFHVILSRTKIGKVASSHTLRHSFATHMIQRGVDIKTLQRLLGHSDMATTSQYLHVFIEGPSVQSPLDFG